MRWVEEAWYNGLSSSTIRNCFWKTRILGELSEKAKTMRENENNAQPDVVEMFMKTDAEFIYRYPMAAISVEIENLEEGCAVHLYLTDEEIIKTVDKFEFPEEEADLPIVPDFSIVEKLDRTSEFLEMLERESDYDNNLRKKVTILRETYRSLCFSKQTLITDHFSQ
ncbi:hypothetical protein DFQ28_009650 [Apophysomyces sp. BC1034]|nr:hypothetical protein DFQ29_008844 [Apophysomyces sp. BC1021]KAG0192245.1 hypothetical protein DFQ28_009650 [Apophysomyces sp. BC1034]